ncbi:hypothetical protein C8Q73DRAFT_769955 [Cubamyces lactineus]|nr:hypothetical protein C8Q73DRAFT_769955 [Cubamyces lactineus]
MRNHNTPRNLDCTQEKLWNGPPITAGPDQPVSFIMRGMAVRRPSHDTDDDTGEAAVEPRGLPPATYKEPPERTYLSQVELPPDIDPERFIIWNNEKFYVINGKYYSTKSTQKRNPMQKREMAKPIPGLTKRARGRQVPNAETNTDPRRKYICPVETCKKAFTKRHHVHRHILTIHNHDHDEHCHIPWCNASSPTIRRDNHIRHRHKHTHYQEIFACTPENDWKGIHLLNPQIVHPLSANIKPYANISIHPIALSLWVFHERRRRQGLDAPRPEETDCGRYFLAHPEEMEAALAGHPSWDWKMPPADPREFRAIDKRCMEGRFQLNVQPNAEGSV